MAGLSPHFDEQHSTQIKKCCAACDALNTISASSRCKRHQLVLTT